MNIFPKFNEQSIQDANAVRELPIAKEYAWDFDKNDFIMENGKTKIVTGSEAVKIWVYKALKTPRYEHPAYSFDYGHELEELMNLGLSKEALQSETQRYLNDCLKVNPYIKDVRNVCLEINLDELNINFVVDTLYSEVNINV